MAMELSGLGTAAVKCRLCKHEADNLVEHMVKEHPKQDLASYVEGGGLLWNSIGLQNIETLRRPMKARERESISVKKLFGFKTLDRYGVIAKRELAVPTGNPDFIFPKMQTALMLMFLERAINNHIYVAGPSGAGKTEFVKAVLDKLNWALSEMNADSYQTRTSVIGTWVVRGKEMEFQYGLLPLAMMNGHVLLINEYDTINPQLANVLKPVLERVPRLTLMEKGGEVIHAHTDFRVIATSNTWGRGDDSGMFVNTHTQSIADMRRFSAFIKVDFLQPDEEHRLITKKFPDLDGDEAKLMVAVGTEIREACAAHRIDRTFSTAELVNWAETYLQVGDVREAARVCFLNAYPGDSEIAVLGIIDTKFGFKPETT